MTRQQLGTIVLPVEFHGLVDKLQFSYLYCEQMQRNHKRKFYEKIFKWTIKIFKRIDAINYLRRLEKPIKQFDTDQLTHLRFLRKFFSSSRQ